LTVAQLVQAILRARPEAGLLIQTTVKRPLYTKRDAQIEVWHDGKLWLPDKTVEGLGTTPDGLWDRWREALEVPRDVRAELARIDVHRLARGERRTGT